jgi:ech hydrogenase subunit E
LSRTIIPFGPQHPVLPEPIHLKLELEDEVVVGALPQIGYVHRGLEGLVEKKDINQLIYVTERVCGICSHQHSMCYCETLEKMMKIEVPERGKFLRTIWAELHRIHSHLLWLGLQADAFGYESLFMQTWRVREKAVDLMEKTAGTRIIISVNVIGGVRRDLDATMIREMKDFTVEMRDAFKKFERAFGDDKAIKQRTCGVGVIPKADMIELGGVGPTLRGSGVAEDCRNLADVGAYSKLSFEPIVEHDGDCYARMMVRMRETIQANELIAEALDKMPEGPINVEVKEKPEGEYVNRIEQPRGECVYYIKGNGSKKLDRLRIRTPTFANVPPLLKMLPGCQLADVPVIVLSIDPCISCTER